MNKIWLYMMLFSSAVLLVINPGAMVNEMTNQATGAVTLGIELWAVYTVWLGLLEIVEKSGLSAKLAKLLRPLIRKLYKTDDTEAQKMIAMNMSANMLGLGNAATPMGIKAMQRLDDGSGIINRPMIMLLIVNATSIQFLPTTVIGLRAASGSASPSDIILPTLLATICTTVTGVSLVLLIEYLRDKRKRKKQ